MFDHCTYTEQYDPHVYVYHVPCGICGQVTDIPLPAEGLFAYRRSALMQHAFPMLSPELREMLISNICPACWNAMFPSDEDN